MPFTNPSHHCDVCSHEREDEIRQLYLEWVDIERLSLWFSLNPDILNEHLKALGWDVDRSKDTTRFYRAIVRVGGQHFLNHPQQMRAETVSTAARQLDKIEGREQKARTNDADLDRERKGILRHIDMLVEQGMDEAEAQKVFRDTMPEMFEGVDADEFNRWKSKWRN